MVHLNKLIVTGLVLAVMVCKTSTLVHAQQAGPTEYILKVSPQEIDLIGKGLGSMPFNDVAALIQKLRQQVVEQQQPTTVVKPPEVKPEQK